MAKYTVNADAVAHCRRLIDARQYVLDSDWGDVQPSAEAQNAYLEKHSWAEYANWHLGLTVGATDRDQGPLRVRLRRLPAGAPDRPDRLRLPGRGVAAQGRRTGRPRAAPAPGPDLRLIPRRNLTQASPRQGLCKRGHEQVPTEKPPEAQRTSRSSGTGVELGGPHEPESAVQRVRRGHLRQGGDHHLGHAGGAGPTRGRPATSARPTPWRRPAAATESIRNSAWSARPARSRHGEPGGHQVTVPSIRRRRPPPPATRSPGRAAPRRAAGPRSPCRPSPWPAEQTGPRGSPRAVIRPASAYSSGRAGRTSSPRSSCGERGDEPRARDWAPRIARRPRTPRRRRPGWSSGRGAVQHQHEALPGELGEAVAGHLGPQHDGPPAPADLEARSGSGRRPARRRSARRPPAASSGDVPSVRGTKRCSSIAAGW